MCVCVCVQDDECPKRRVQCKYCELDLAFEDLAEHDATCGSRTDLCKDCGKRLQLRHMEKHLREHQQEQPTVEGALQPAAAAVPAASKQRRNERITPQLGRQLSGASATKLPTSVRAGRGGMTAQSARVTPNQQPVRGLVLPSRVDSPGGRSNSGERQQLTGATHRDKARKAGRAPPPQASRAGGRMPDIDSPYSDADLDQIMSALLSQEDVFGPLEPPASASFTREKQSRDPTLSAASLNRFGTDSRQQPGEASQAASSAEAMQTDEGELRSLASSFKCGKELSLCHGIGKSTQL